MSLIPRSSLLNSSLLDFDNFFDSFFAPSTRSEGSNGFFAPRIDLKESDTHYQVSAELPGVKKEDIHITLDNGVLSLEAEVKDESSEEKDGKVIRQERRYGKFMRSFNVGSGVKEEDIEASFEDGVLKLSAPKVQSEEAPSRRIKIS